MMVVYHKEGNMSVKIRGYPMLGFWDSEKVGGILGEIFIFVIIATIEKFNVSQILLDGKSSCSILYLDLFEKMTRTEANF